MPCSAMSISVIMPWRWPCVALKCKACIRSKYCSSLHFVWNGLTSYSDGVAIDEEPLAPTLVEPLVFGRACFIKEAHVLNAGFDDLLIDIFRDRPGGIEQALLVFLLHAFEALTRGFTPWACGSRETLNDPDRHLGLIQFDRDDLLLFG